MLVEGQSNHVDAVKVALMGSYKNELTNLEESPSTL
jgi:hypothetical protein